MKKNLSYIAAQVRIDALRMIYAAQSGHPGSSFSCVDILVTLFFGGFIKFDAQNPHWAERDYFIMSKGHGCPALYAILGELGYFSKDEFYRLRQVDSLLQGHPEVFIPGIEVASGPLGQGMSVANGIALGLRMDGKQNTVFSLHGDGELQEGNIWEATMTSAKYGIDHLISIVDRNHLQIDGSTEEVKSVGDVAEKFRAFGWEVFETDGHNFVALSETITKAKEVTGKPTCIVANTIKGKGVSFMENQVGWHGKAPNDEEFQKALTELEHTLFEAQ
ncbi:transketolase [Candidatus Peregrinibacteria bacterium]|nr:MAG: transketolase [Candidatus Peregrinibacteria bacterium]